MKKLVALVLAMMMLLSVIPAQAASLPAHPASLDEIGIPVPEIPKGPTTWKDYTYDEETQVLTLTMDVDENLWDDVYILLGEYEARNCQYDQAQDTWYFDFSNYDWIGVTVEDVQGLELRKTNDFTKPDGSLANNRWQVTDKNAYGTIYQKSGEGVFQCYWNNGEMQTMGCDTVIDGTQVHFILKNDGAIDEYYYTAPDNENLDVHCSARGEVMLSYFDPEKGYSCNYTEADGWYRWGDNGFEPVEAPVGIDPTKYGLLYQPRVDANNPDNLPILNATEMPKELANVVTLPESAKIPDVSTSYDPDTGILTVTVDDPSYWANNTSVNLDTLTGNIVSEMMDQTGNSWKFDLGSAGISPEDVQTFRLYGNVGEEKRYSSLHVNLSTGEKECNVWVQTDNGFVFLQSNDATGSLVPSNAIVAMQTEFGVREVNFRAYANGEIASYSYALDDKYTLHFAENGLSEIYAYTASGTYRWHWDEGWTLGVYNSELGYMEYTFIDAPADAPNPEAIAPLFSLPGETDSTPTVMLSTIPNNVADVAEIDKAPEDPKLDMQYDEATGELRIKVTTADGNPVDYIHLCTQDGDWLYSVTPNEADDTWSINLAEAGLTMEDIAKVYYEGKSNATIYMDGWGYENKENSGRFDLASGTVSYTFYQVTDTGVVTFEKEDGQVHATSLLMTVHNGQGLYDIRFNLDTDGNILNYTAHADQGDISLTYDAEGLVHMDMSETSAQWDREHGWHERDWDEAGNVIYTPVEKPSWAPDPEEFPPILGAPVPVEPVKPKRTWYPNNTVCVAGLYLKDTVKNLTNKWYNVVPVDISKDGSQTYTLVASGMYVIGRATVTVKGDDVTVTYKYPQGYIEPQSETLAWFTDIDQITTEYLNNPTGNARFGRKVSKANDLNGQDIALLFICNRVTYRQPYYLDGGSLTRYWPNSSYHEGYVKYLRNLLDAMK